MADKIKILLVEDNPGDVDLTRENLESCKMLHELYVAVDGVDALAFLRQQDKYQRAVRPDLILLDLNLPRKDGREVLAEIKADATLRRIPVVILTSSQAEEDVIRSYDLHASAYIVKPVDFLGFSQIVKAIDGFWFSVVRYPSE
jgi:CheY-like chemotaxis protein